MRNEKLGCDAVKREDLLNHLFGYSLLTTHYSLKIPEVFLCSRMK